LLTFSFELRAKPRRNSRLCRGRRTATLIADTPVIAYVFASATVAQMEREDPSLPIAFHRMMVRIEAERLRFTSHELEALLP
jgi:hypothetical protein